ncbi:helix-turn-helix domain-containing protein [Sphingomonas sp. TDK1]|uniref:helix-turn-helix domain-containing protein n=1 Tax=Sphingomonas sp. TDK1 TaxID=453247 RepID=UPI0018DCF530
MSSMLALGTSVEFWEFGALRAFAAVAEQRSFSRAAEQLGVSSGAEPADPRAGGTAGNPAAPSHHPPRRSPAAAR